MSTALLLASVAIADPVIDSLYDDWQLACREREVLCLRVWSMQPFWTRYGALHDPTNLNEVWPFATAVAFTLAQDEVSSQSELDAMAQLLLSAGPYGVEHGVDLLEHHDDIAIRAAIARGSRWMRRQDAEELLQLALTDSEAEVRRTAVDALLWNPHAAQLAHLLDLVEADGDDVVCQRALRAKSWLGATATGVSQPPEVRR